MSNQSDPDTDLTPEGIEVLNGIREETAALLEIDLANTPPAPVFQAD